MTEYIIKNITGSFQIIRTLSMGEVDANNQPGISAGSTYNLLLKNTSPQIFGSTQIELLDLINNDVIVFQLSGSDLTKSESIEFFNSQSQSIQNIRNETIVDDSAILIVPTLNTNQNNFDPIGFRDASGRVLKTKLYLNSSGNIDITGLAAPTPAINSVVEIYNIGNVTGGGNIKIVNNSSLSISTNRTLSGGKDITLVVGEMVSIIYEPNINSRWILNR